MLDNVATLVVNNISIYKSSVFFMVLGELIESVVVFGHIRASELQRRFFKDLRIYYKAEGIVKESIIEEEEIVKEIIWEGEGYNSCVTQ